MRRLAEITGPLGGDESVSRSIALVATRLDRRLICYNLVFCFCAFNACPALFCITRAEQNRKPPRTRATGCPHRIPALPLTAPRAARRLCVRPVRAL